MGRGSNASSDRTEQQENSGERKTLIDWLTNLSGSRTPAFFLLLTLSNTSELVKPGARLVPVLIMGTKWY